MLQREIENKIDLLVCELTLQEKIDMIHGAGLFRTGGVDRLGIPPVRMSDGPMGVRFEFHNDSWGRSGHNDDYITYCPSNSAIASTWSRKLARKAGAVLGEEARGRGKDVILAPGINVKRTPLCGRNFEYFSEDPYLISEMAVPVIKGIQSADVGACVKHFALNSQETERLWVNVEVSDRALREIYLPGFDAAVHKAESYSIMGAYNLFRGQHCCESKSLLGDVLRNEWGYDGMVVSDWGGVHDTKAAAESGLDVEMSVFSNFDEYCMADPLKELVEAGEIEESRVDAKVKNIIRFMLRTKMIDIAEDVDESGERKVYAVPDDERKAGTFNSLEHQRMVLETAREAVVLLKNEDNRLPLERKKLRKLLIVGDNGARIHANGGGSAELAALYEICTLLGLKMKLGGGCQVDYAQGYYVPEQEETDTNWQADSVDDADADTGSAPKPDDGCDAVGLAKQMKLRQEALELAKDYDDIIFVGGLNHDIDKEGYDREDLKLPYGQDELIKGLLDINPDTVIVMMSGNPVDMTEWADRAKAILWMSYCGMQGGTALAEIILGDVNPSGKLPDSFPAKAGDTPPAVFGDFPGRPLTDDEKKTMHANLTQTFREGVFVGYRYYDTYNIPVQFCFGHGLSYTDFQYGEVTARWSDGSADGMRRLNVQTTVTNTGDRTGKETIQLYIGDDQVQPGDPVKELKDFKKLCILPGETKIVDFTLTEKDLSHYDEESSSWRYEDTAKKIYVGASLKDIRCTAVIE